MSLGFPPYLDDGFSIRLGFLLEYHRLVLHCPFIAIFGLGNISFAIDLIIIPCKPQVPYAEGHEDTPSHKGVKLPMAYAILGQFLVVSTHSPYVYRVRGVGELKDISPEGCCIGALKQDVIGIFNGLVTNIISRGDVNTFTAEVGISGKPVLAE